jgi:hypothetical protein
VRYQDCWQRQVKIKARPSAAQEGSVRRVEDGGIKCEPCPVEHLPPLGTGEWNHRSQILQKFYDRTIAQNSPSVSIIAGYEARNAGSIVEASNDQFSDLGGLPGTNSAHSIGDTIRLYLHFEHETLQCEARVARVEPRNGQFGVAVELRSYVFG